MMEVIQEHHWKSIAVIGVGNLLMGDDGIGIHVIGELEKRSYPPNIEIYDAMMNAFLVLECLDKKDLGIIVDAYHGGESPGRVHIVSLNPNKLERYTEDFNLSLHDFKFLDALRSAEQVYQLPEKIVLIGVEPDRLEPTMELSSRIKNVMPEIIKRIDEELRL
jgi:hydrogenase maturation protease